MFNDMDEKTGKEKRQNPRVPLGRKAIIVTDDHMKIPGKIKDISEAGAGLLLPYDRKRGEQFTLYFVLPTLHGNLKILARAKVAHCHLKGGLYYVGVALLNLDEDIKKEIQAYVENKSRHL